MPCRRILQEYDLGVEKTLFGNTSKRSSATPKAKEITIKELCHMLAYHRAQVQGPEKAMGLNSTFYERQGNYALLR